MSKECYCVGVDYADASKIWFDHFSEDFSAWELQGGLESIDRIIEPRRCKECGALDGETTTETIGPATFFAKLKAKLFGLVLYDWAVTWCANGHVVAEGCWYDTYVCDRAPLDYGYSPIFDVWEDAKSLMEADAEASAKFSWDRPPTFTVSDYAKRGVLPEEE